MGQEEWVAADRELRDLLGLAVPPIAIAFAAAAPADVPALASTKPAPTADGRTGAVPAGCVFWNSSMDCPAPGS